MENMVFLPVPKEINLGEGIFLLNGGMRLLLPACDRDELFPAASRLQDMVKKETGLYLPVTVGTFENLQPAVSFEKDPELQKEEYSLEIGESGIQIRSGDGAGAFYAVSTMKQLVLQRGKQLPFLHIKDRPEFRDRGIMMDISRDRVPKMETLYQVVDLMADLKLNQLQLYIEGFSFAYPSFPEVWRDATPVTGDEILKLDRYCRERYIDLVPNQNSFGHMGPWLARKEFRPLADCQGEFEMPWGKVDTPLGLNPLDPDTLSFLARTYDDLLPNFTSSLFNVGCDETFDLGQGQSREACEQKGKGRVYLDFLLKIYGMLQKRGRKMMFWGDIIKEYPELIKELPRDIIVLEWGYNEDQPKEENCKKLAETGLDYYVCPGTNTWNSITGRTWVTQCNLRNAAKLGKQYGARGFLNTDWGDGGHWQPLPASYPGYCYGAALSWGVEDNLEVDLAAAMDRFIFRDRKGKMGQFMLDLGNYTLCEKKSAYNGTDMFRTLLYSQYDDKNTFLSFLHLHEIDVEEYRKVGQYVRSLQKTLQEAEMHCPDAELVEAELQNAMAMVLHGAELGLVKLDQMEAAEKKERVKGLLQDLNAILLRFRQNWVARSRMGGLAESLTPLENLKKQYEEALKSL